MIGFRLFRSQMPSLLLYALFPRVKQKELTSFTITENAHLNVKKSEKNCHNPFVMIKKSALLTSKMGIVINS